MASKSALEQIKVQRQFNARQFSRLRGLERSFAKMVAKAQDPRWWETLSRYGITHVRHFWDGDGRRWRALGGDEPSTAQISDLLPRPWARILRKGKQPLAWARGPSWRFAPTTVAATTSTKPPRISF